MNASGHPTGTGKSGNEKVHPVIITRQSIWGKINNWMPGFFTLVVCLALLIGWRLKRFELITPKHGIGYALGIFGAVFMAVLFIYSLRKRMSGLEAIGSVKMWFRIHMVLGILGPVFILFHANFSLGSLNSNVALFSMLIVAGSGVIGRYIYSRIHYGLYGKRATLTGLQNNFEQQKERIGLQFERIPGAKEELLSFTKEALVPSTALLESIKRLLAIRWKSQRTLWKIQRVSAGYFNPYAIKHKWGFFRKLRMRKQIQRKAAIFLNQGVKVVEFNFYERLFSLWHMLHIPLVFILVFAVVLHLIAVNRY